MVMESINVVIDDAIKKVSIVDSGEGPSSKETTVEGEAQDVEVEEHSTEKESTLVNSRMETRSMSRSSSPLTPPEVHSPISRMMKCPPQRSHHQEWLKIIRKVTLSCF